MPTAEWPFSQKLVKTDESPILAARRVDTQNFNNSTKYYEGA